TRIATAHKQRQIGQYQSIYLDDACLIELCFRLLAPQCIDVPFCILTRPLVPIAFHHCNKLLNLFARHTFILPYPCSRDTFSEPEAASERKNRTEKCRTEK